MNPRIGKLFAKIEDGAVAAYPVDLQRAFPRSSLPKDRAPSGYAIVKTSPVPPLGVHQFPVEQAPAFIGDEWVQQWAVQEMLPLDGLKAALCLKVNDDAETERLKYITKGAGQALTYARKLEQALKAIQEDDPAPGDYKLLRATLGTSDGNTIKEVAATVIAMNDRWEDIGEPIETVRITTKEAIEEAETHDAARALYAAIVWPGPPGA